MAYWAYMRISTQEERGLQKFSRQEKALSQYKETKKIDFEMIFQDDASGKNFDRDGWKKLESWIKQDRIHSGDTIVFKDICRFTRDADNGYQKYMEIMNKGIEMIFIDNPVVSTPYIKNMMGIAEKMDRIPAKALQNTVELLLICELDRAEKEREITVKRIKDGIAASDKKSGRVTGTVDKLTEDLRKDIKSYLADRSVKGSDVMKKHGISRNTFKKYVELVKGEE